MGGPSSALPQLHSEIQVAGGSSHLEQSWLPGQGTKSLAKYMPSELSQVVPTHLSLTKTNPHGHEQVQLGEEVQSYHVVRRGRGRKRRTGCG